MSDKRTYIAPPLKKCYWCKELRPAWYMLELAPSQEMVYACEDCFDEDKIEIVPNSMEKN